MVCAEDSAVKWDCTAAQASSVYAWSRREGGMETVRELGSASL